MKFVLYYRLSKKKKTVEQYGIPAQKESVARYLATQQSPEIVGEFTEHESGSVNNRPQLQAAMTLAKSTGAILCVARLDRLSRSASFLLTLRDSNLTFICCDYPQMDRLMCGVLALVAEREREMISARVTAGLAIARKTKKLGCPVAKEAWSKAMVSIRKRKTAFAVEAYKSIQEIRSTGCESLSKISHYMNLRGHKTRLGGKYTTTAIKRILATVEPHTI